MTKIRQFFFYFSLFSCMAILLGMNVQAEDPDKCIVFSDSGAELTGITEGVTANGTHVTISAAGEYLISGSCSDGYIEVAKDTGDVKLTLCGLNLTSSDYAPLSLKGGSNDISISAKKGTKNYIADSASSAKKAAINASKEITFKGKGELNVTGNCKNGIKSDDDIEIDGELTLNVTAVDNGISADNNLTITEGTVNVTSTGGDGLCSKPDTVSETDLTLTADGDVEINGGSVKVNAQAGDAIQADHNFTMTQGTVSLETKGGYTTTIASTDDGSYKGIKAASELSISGGSLNINTADDAIHCDQYTYITGGNLTINTGDDGAHADTSLVVGSDNGGCPLINISNCYEGLEAGTVYIYSGDIDIRSSDDGINAAGGSSNGSDPGADGGGGSFNPGGGFGPWGGGGSRPSDPGTASGDYSINIYGGDTYINADGDGIDSNGTITMNGGKLVVFGMQAGGDNSALDYEQSMTLNGGFLLAAGSKGVGNITPTAGSQKYSAKSISVTSGNYINVSNGSAAVFSAQAPKKIEHVVFSAPSGTSWTISTGTAASFTCTHAKITTLHAAEATASSSGYTGDRYCSNCGQLIEAGSVIPALGESSEDPESEDPTKLQTLSADQFTFTSPASTVYDGNAKTVAVTAKESGIGTIKVKYYKNGKQLSEARDAGIYTVKIDVEAGSKYESSQDLTSETWTFTITPCPIANCKIALSAYSFAFNNKVQRPAVTVKSPSGSLMANGTDYALSFDGSKNVGLHKLSVTATGNYSGSRVLTYKINPAAKAVSSIKAGKKKLTVKWKKSSTAYLAQTGGYQIRYSLKSSMASAKTITVAKASATSKAITKLKAKKKYYIQIRTYKKVNGTKYCSSWSKIKSAKTK